MYQHLYSEFIKRNPQVKHFAAHSHHYWPDVTRDAMLEYWEDSAQYVDKKWNVILGEKVPETQKLMAQFLSFPRPRDIVFSSNTHDFVVRLLSCLDYSKKPRILTTDSEFYSFERQMRRLEEDNLVEIVRIPTEPFHDLEDRLLHEIRTQNWDMIFLSHVFFNSGVALRRVPELAEATPPDTLFVLDGYHSYFALPVNLSEIGKKIFFMAGGYKYAQSGEGACFMTLPENCQLRPKITSWFADMAGLENFSDFVGYSNDGYRFAGATMDYTSVYRMRAVLKLFSRHQITPEQIHNYVQKQQKLFLDHIEDAHHPQFKISKLVWRGDLKDHGHFLSFDFGSSEKTTEIYNDLKRKNILTDYRKSRLRFGFALYHNGPYQLFT